jgi:hypothetical protein
VIRILSLAIRAVPHLWFGVLAKVEGTIGVQVILPATTATLVKLAAAAEGQDRDEEQGKPSGRAPQDARLARLTGRTKEITAFDGARDGA